MNPQYIKINMVPNGVVPVLYCSQYDVGRPLGMVVYNGSETVDLDDYTVTLEATRTDGTAITAAITTDGNVCALETTATMTNKADRYPAQIVVTDGNGNRIASIPVTMMVVKAAMDENAEGVEEDRSLYQQYTGTVQSLIADIRTQLNAETAARQAAVSAEASARQAALSAETAARQAEDQTLTANLASEVSARQTADSNLQSAIASEASTRATQDASLQSQINQLIAPSGEAPSAAEVENARVGADGTVYPTLGDAIRTQDTQLKSALSVNNHIDFELTLGKSVDATGAVASNTYMAVTQRIACDGGDIVKRLIPNTDSNSKHLALYVAEYAGTSFVKRTEMIAVNSTLTLGSTTDSVILSFGRYSSSKTAITQADVDTYFSVEVYRRSMAQANFDDYIANDAFISRGNVVDIGYTSFSQCSVPGIYTFSTANISSISDAPPGLNTGGILLTYVAGNAVWQEIHTTYYEYIRYRTSGTWLDKKRFIRVAYVSGAGNDGSIEGVDVFIKRGIDGKGVRYSMGHCVDATANANVWRLMYIYSLAANQVGGTVMTRRGEFECALHLSGRPDFSGGYVHGDEIDQAVTFIGDGNVMTAPEVSGFYTNFRIVRNSILYDPNDNATPIANHGVEYIFTADGLTIKQSVKWLVDASLTSCYLAMLPILKAFSTYRYDDTSFTVAENNQSGYSITIPDASSVTEYIDAISTTMGIEKYPDGLTGGDCALITDNGGESYNKAYFVVCTSGSITAGTLWKSVTKYKIE